jgi:hypothetical protein
MLVNRTNLRFHNKCYIFECISLKKGKLLALRRSIILKVAFKVGMFVFAFTFSLLWWLVPQIYLQENRAIYIYFILPALLFLVSCLFGITIVPKFGLKSVIIPNFIGSLVSSVVVINDMISRYSLSPAVIFTQGLITTFYSLMTFFISFTAMTIGVIRKVSK